MHSLDLNATKFQLFSRPLPYRACHTVHLRLSIAPRVRCVHPEVNYSRSSIKAFASGHSRSCVRLSEQMSALFYLAKFYVVGGSFKAPHSANCTGSQKVCRGRLCAVLTRNAIPITLIRTMLKTKLLLLTRQWKTLSIFVPYLAEAIPSTPQPHKPL